jgi:glycosyltransferase involved in cell wall biosynthesis
MIGSTANTVSVIVPCFNAGAYLEPCIASIFEQQGPFEVVEVLIVDDGSTDQVTLNALRTVSRIPSVVILGNTRRKGAAGARNTGIDRASGTWLAFLDADDWWPKNSLALRFEAVDMFPGAAWVGGDFCDVADDAQPTGEGRFWRNLKNYPFVAPAYNSPKRPLLFETPLEQFLVAAPTHTCATLIRRDVALAHGGFAEHLLRAQDFHLWLRLAATPVPFVFVPHVLAFYRHHTSNSTRSASHTLEWRRAALHDLLHIDAFAACQRALAHQIGAVSLALSYEYRKERRFREATRSALSSLAREPASVRVWKTLLASLLCRA